jgi:hypothetical protein
MYNIVDLTKIEDYFTPYSLRSPKGVYFCRFSDYNCDWDQDFFRYLKEAKQCGVYIQGKIPNPDQRQLDYYKEMLGLSFRLDTRFLDESLKKWLPRLTPAQRSVLVDGLWEMLDVLRKNGKTEDLLRNAYVKFMCWFYYRFERVLTQLGKEPFPKILYEGAIGDYQLKLLYLLSRAGCDVLLILPDGETAYRKVDPCLHYTRRMINPRPEPFPPGFSVGSLVCSEPVKLNDKQKVVSAPVFRADPPKSLVKINTWLSGNLMADSMKTMQQRGGEPDTFYNMFVRMRGAEDQNTYRNELIRWKLKLETARRTVCIVEQAIPMPSPDEIAQVNRQNVTGGQQLLQHLLSQIQFPKCRELEQHAKKAFEKILSQYEGEPLQKLNNRAVCVLCWIRRYLPKLFPDWKLESLPTFVYYGACANETEVAWLRILSRLPVDVWIVCPDLNLPDQLADPLLFDRLYEYSLPMEDFPRQVDAVQFGTVAYHAEQELNTILYQDSGMYRNLQFKKAIPVTIQTTYEEIAILWEQESKYRPNFEILTDRVMLPVICAKVSGVPGGNLEKYWSDIGKLLGEDVIISDHVPFMQRNPSNPLFQHAPSFLKNQKLQIQKIKSHPAYSYSFIREDMQDYMLEKIQELIERQLIVGTFQTGTEYTIISTALNLDKKLLRMIQKFDFTKEIPKLVFVNTGEQVYSLEDSILTAYLNLLGFDIALFVPTGYQVMERFFTKPFFVEQQAGEYMYDLRAPDWNRISETQRRSLSDLLFRRGK